LISMISSPESPAGGAGEVGTAGSDTTILICAHCVQTFHSAAQMKDHYKQFHKESVVSESGGQQRRLGRKLNRHMCGLCAKHFGDSWTLTHHQKTVHQAAREHVCNKCHKSFLSNKDMVRHYKGVHLKQKIVFPGSLTGKKVSHSKDPTENAIKSKEVSQKFRSKSNMQKEVLKIQNSDNKTVPNILKNANNERRTGEVVNCQSTDNLYGKVNKVIGIEKAAALNSVIVDEISLSVQETDPSICLDKMEDSLTRSPQDSQLLDMFEEEQPMFQLENLENLQLILPDGLGEPRIIIPESGIRLSIPDESISGEPGRKILHLIPESFPEPQQDEEATDAVHDLHLPANVPDIAFDIDTGKTSSEISNDVAGENNIEQVEESPSVEYPKRFVYKKVVGGVSPHLVSVKQLPNSSSHLPEQFKCQKCDKHFISNDFLERHISTMHAQTEEQSNFVNIFSGNLESLDIESERRLGPLVSLNEMIDVGNFSGEELAGGSLLKSDVMFSNAESVTMDDSSHSQCKPCGLKFSSKALYLKHKKVAHKKQTAFRCEICSSVFTSNQTLKAHTESVHEGIKKVCSICLKPVADLVRHTRYQHKNSGKREHCCDVCQATFRSNFSLQRHKETVHLKVKAWPCDLCEKSFGEKRDMLRHKNAVHYGLKSRNSTWRCPECNFTFKLRREYDNHKSTFHANLTEEQIIKFLNSEMETKNQKYQVKNFQL